MTCLLYTSDAADERSSVDLGGRRIIKKKNKDSNLDWQLNTNTDTRTVEYMHTSVKETYQKK